MRHFVSTFHRAIAALLLVAGVAAAAPISLTTPAGLNPGDKFRFIAVTPTTTSAASSDINSYNTFVQNAFGGATYGGVTITWKAIGTTSSVNANDNVGGFFSNVSVYTPFTGTRVATDLKILTNGLWSGTLLAAPNETLSATLAGVNVWTGADKFGYGYVGNRLGESDPIYGNSGQSDDFWLFSATDSINSGLRPMYGLSEELTVGGGSPVPEIDPAGMGSVLALVGGALGMLERRRKRTP